MLDPSIFTEESPLSNLERREIWRRKLWAWKAEEYWSSSHPGEDGIVEDDIINDLACLPSALRRQAE